MEADFSEPNFPLKTIPKPTLLQPAFFDNSDRPWSPSLNVNKQFFFLFLERNEAFFFFLEGEMCWWFLHNMHQSVVKGLCANRNMRSGIGSFIYGVTLGLFLIECLCALIYKTATIRAALFISDL